MRDSGLYITSLTVGARTVKNSSISLAAKLGTKVGLGAISLVGYKFTQTNLTFITHRVKTTVYKVTTTITIGIIYKYKPNKTNIFLLDSFLIINVKYIFT